MPPERCSVEQISPRWQRISAREDHRRASLGHLDAVRGLLLVVMSCLVVFSAATLAAVAPAVRLSSASVSVVGVDGGGATVKWVRLMARTALSKDRLATSKLSLGEFRLQGIELIDPTLLTASRGYAGVAPTRIVPRVSELLGGPELFTAHICPAITAPDSIPSVAVYQWGALALVFTGTGRRDHFLELTYNAGGWNGQVGGHAPWQPPVLDEPLWPRIVGPDGIAVGETLGQILRNDPGLSSDLHRGTLFLGQLRVFFASHDGAGPHAPSYVVELSLPSNWNC